MRRWIVLAIAAAVAACSGRAAPPEGKWQGVYSGPEAIIAARVEVEKDGRVRLSAPDAFADYTRMPPAEKAATEQRLLEGLRQSWPDVTPRAMDFDGRTFRMPGGVAPQLIYDATTRHMTMIIYPGSQPTIRIDLDPVEEFAE